MNSLIPIPTPQPRVPLEIQLTIVEMCPDVRTRLTLAGARLALRLPSTRVRLHTESAARSFFAFCSAQGLPRERSSPLGLLHTLDITLATVNPADIGNLVTLLANVPKLMSLTLRDPEQALRRQSSLYVALQRLRTLKGFTVDQASTMSFKLVSEIASALEHVHIDPYGAPADENDVDTLNLNTVLACHKDTLKCVCVRSANVLEDEDEFDGDLVVFEKVHHLGIPGCVIPGAVDFARAFPNVVSLHVGNLLTGHTRRWSAHLEEMRYENLFALVGQTPPARCHRLKLVRGGLLDLCVFGNICITDVLEIDEVIKDDWGWKCIPPVVKCHVPTILRLSVSPSLPVDVWERQRDELKHVNCLVLRFVVDDLCDLEHLVDTAVRAAVSFIGCRTVFLDFIGENDAARAQLGDIDPIPIVARIAEESHSGSVKNRHPHPGRDNVLASLSASR